MKKYSVSFWLMISIAVLAVVFVFLLLRPAATLAKSSLFIGNNRFEVLVADTPVLRAQGLSGTKSLSADGGMIFIFDKPDRYGFWMKDMNYPLDFVWVESHAGGARVADITENVAPGTYPEVFKPSVPATAVLEVSAGTIKNKNIKIGDEVSFFPVKE